MAYVIASDILEGAGDAVVEGGSVLAVSRSFQVVGCNAPPFAEASALIATGLPAPWSVHPAITTCNLTNYGVRLQGGGGAIVTATYSNVEPQFLVRIGCALKTISTDMDRFGTPVLVSNHNVAQGYDIDASPATASIQAGVCTVLRPDATLIVQRVFPSVRYGGYDPLELAVDYAGRTNSQTVLGAAPGTLLLESVSADNQGFGYIAFRASFEFRYDPNGWNPEICYVDHETGQPWPYSVKAPGFDQRAVSSSTDVHYGRKIVDQYEQVDFSLLLM